jgi:hypothetical protein
LARDFFGLAYLHYHKNMKRLFPALAVLALVTIPLARAQKQAEASSPDDDLREVVFRYQFKAINLQAGAYFLAVDNKNPSDALLARFRDNMPVVKSVSDSRTLKKPVVTIVDKKTEQQGVLFRTGRITRSGDAKADVEGGYECGDLCDAARGTYHLVRDATGWSVQSFEAASKPAS